MNDDWGYELAQAVLDAAVSCGADCSTRRVTEWGEAFMTCPTECCELVVSVLEGLSATPESKCSALRTARVELSLMVCWPIPDTDGTRDVLVDAGLARDYSILRWQILKGVLSGWRLGLFCLDSGDCVGGGCEAISIDGWRSRGVEGPCKAFTLELGFRSAI